MKKSIIQISSQTIRGTKKSCKKIVAFKNTYKILFNHFSVGLTDDIKREEN